MGQHLRVLGSRPGNDPVNGAFAFWNRSRAIRAAASGASVTIETHCQYTHSVHVGRRLDTAYGVVTATHDGGAPVTLDCNYPAATTSQTRRLLFSGVAADQHKMVITLSGNKKASSQGWYFISTSSNAPWRAMFPIRSRQLPP